MKQLLLILFYLSISFSMYSATVRENRVLIKYNDQTKEFEFSNATEQVLLSTNGPYYFAVFIGDSKNGKSYLASRVEEGGDADYFPQSDSPLPGTNGINFKASVFEKGTLIIIDTEGTANGDASHHAKMQAILRYFHALVIYVQSPNVDNRSMNYLGEYLWKDMKHDNKGVKCMAVCNMCGTSFNQDSLNLLLNNQPAERQENIKKGCSLLLAANVPQCNSSSYSEKLKLLRATIKSNLTPLQDSNGEINSPQQMVTLIKTAIDHANAATFEPIDTCLYPKTIAATQLKPILVEFRNNFGTASSYYSKFRKFKTLEDLLEQFDKDYLTTKSKIDNMNLHFPGCDPIVRGYINGELDDHNSFRETLKSEFNNDNTLLDTITETSKHTCKDPPSSEEKIGSGCNLTSCWTSYSRYIPMCKTTTTIEIYRNREVRTPSTVVRIEDYVHNYTHYEHGILSAIYNAITSPLAIVATLF